jgi:hypothetical protein
VSSYQPQFPSAPGPPPGWASPTPMPANPTPMGAYPTPGPGAAFVPQPVPTRSGLPVTATVLAATALAGVLGVIVWLIAVGAPLPGDGPGGPLTGQVAVRGTTLSGADLASAVRQRIRDDGGDPSQMTCPDTPAVYQGVTTVCHGVIDEDDWAIVVFFEDSSGNYTLLPA